MKYYRASRRQNIDHCSSFAEATLPQVPKQGTLPVRQLFGCFSQLASWLWARHRALNKNTLSVQWFGKSWKDGHSPNWACVDCGTLYKGVGMAAEEMKVKKEHGGRSSHTKGETRECVEADNKRTISFFSYASDCDSWCKTDLANVVCLFWPSAPGDLVRMGSRKFISYTNSEFQVSQTTTTSLELLLFFFKGTLLHSKHWRAVHSKKEREGANYVPCSWKSYPMLS